MHYVIAGYVIVLSILFCYSVSLVWRRRRLARTVGVVEGVRPTGPAGLVDPDRAP